MFACVINDRCGPGKLRGTYHDVFAGQGEVWDEGFHGMQKFHPAGDVQGKT